MKTDHSVCGVPGILQFDRGDGKSGPSLQNWQSEWRTVAGGPGVAALRFTFQESIRGVVLQRCWLCAVSDVDANKVFPELTSISWAEGMSRALLQVVKTDMENLAAEMLNAGKAPEVKVIPGAWLLSDSGLSSLGEPIMSEDDYGGMQQVGVRTSGPKPPDTILVTWEQMSETTRFRSEKDIMSDVVRLSRFAGCELTLEGYTRELDAKSRELDDALDALGFKE